MFQKHFTTLLMAAAVTTAMAFSQQDDTPKQEPQEKQDTIKAVSEDGKLFIIDDEGNKRELDVSGARSIMIQQSNRMVDNNGDQQQDAFGKAIIIGPDGEKTILELDGTNNIQLPGLDMKFGEFERILPELRMPGFPGVKDLEGEFRFDFDMPQVFQMNRGETGKFMIGVHCSPVDEALRSHLQMDEGVGLIVRTVTEGSPANGAELQQHDILVYADDTELGTVADLTAVVENAGEEDREITLTIVRQGNETTATVTPEERPENSRPEMGGFRFALPRGEFQVERMGPGIIMGGGNGDMENAIKQMREQMQQMREEMNQLMERDK
jgi:hypothetical protein